MPHRPRPLLIAAVLCAACAALAILAVLVARPRHTAVATDVPATRAAPQPGGTAAGQVDIAPAQPAPADPGTPAARAPEPPPAPEFGVLDGMPVPEAEREARAAGMPVAVMVDNWVTARPQVGLDRAELVYEALVEFGITRFMAVYWRGDAPWIEPVRSARTQYLGLVSELDAVYAHVGAAADDGPADAGAQMREWDLRSVDEEQAGGAIFRDSRRVAPYNAVTSTDALRAFARTRGWAGPVRVAPWPFKDDGGGADGAPMPAVSMDFDLTHTHAGAFRVRWVYDPAVNAYRRFQAGAPHTDGRSGAQLTARNVILQIAAVRPAGDSDGHVLYDLEGSGRALVLRDGVAVEATWHKDSRTARTRYLDATGSEVSLNRGTTWVELLPASMADTIGG